MKKKILILVTTFALLLSTLLPYSRTVYADEKGISIEELSESIKSVTDAIDKLKGVVEMGDKEAGIIKSIFNGLSGTFSTVGSFVGPINGSISFLKLIGLMKDGTSEALAHIQVQLADITDKLTQMDSKLNRLSEDMMKMQATSEFNARAIKANQMSQAWHDFEANYMEDKMDELMRQYNAMLTDGIKEWIQSLPPAIQNEESTDITIPESEEVLSEENKEEIPETEENAVYDPYRFAVWFRCVNPGNADEGTGDPEYELKIVRANGFDHDHKRDELSKPSPYIIYADDFDNKYDRGLVIDESLLPTSADIDFNIDTYREDLAGIIETKLTEAFKNQEYSRLKTWNI